MRNVFLLLMALLAYGCSNETLLQQPPSGAKQEELLDKTTQKGSVSRYLCKDCKEVRVVRAVQKNKKAKKRTVINLTFNDITQRLTPSVSETGKKYSNIRWHWYEKSDTGMLTNSIGHTLAEGCVKQ